MPVAPASLAALMALTTSLAEPAENSSSRRSARVVPGIIAQLTAGTVTFSRTMLYSVGLVSPSWRTDSLTVVPSSPRIRLTTASMSWPVGRDAVDGEDLVAGAEAGPGRRAAGDDRLDDRVPGGGVHERADAHDRAAQRRVLGDDLVGGEEAGVVGVADGLDQPVDRAVGQLEGVERRRVDEVVVEDLPGLGVGRELRRERARDGGRLAPAGPGGGGVDLADADAGREDGDDQDDRTDGLGDRRQTSAALLLAGRGPGRASGIRGRGQRSDGHRRPGVGGRRRTARRVPGVGRRSGTGRGGRAEGIAGAWDVGGHVGSPV